ncbi:hypothetical protein ACLMJK_005324 [Lecanora helva]
MEQGAGMSKLLTRRKAFAVIITISACSIFYLTWFLPAFSVRNSLDQLLPAQPIPTRAQIHWNNDPRRLVVFGDSWSDNGQYPVDPPPKNLIPDWEEARGKVWTEWLCSTISCTHHDNFARSLPYLWDSKYSGPFVDSDLLNASMRNITNTNNALSTNSDLGEPLADLKTQVQQWLRFEKEQYGTSRVTEIERKGTVFSMWFSLWDLWYYAEKDTGAAEYAVTKAMDTLFQQLDVIAENWPTEMKVIVPEAVDTTFLPGWHSVRTAPRGSDRQGVIQREAVALVEQWNRALDLRANRWQGGSMYIYNTNEWLLDQLRGQQLFDSHLSDANGRGVEQTPWSNVRSGCTSIDKAKGDSKEKTQCSDPKTYLFWDDMHLGPGAMKMLGEGIANDIADNSWFGHSDEMEYKDEHSFHGQDPSSRVLPTPTPSKQQLEP